MYVQFPVIGLEIVCAVQWVGTIVLYVDGAGGV